MNNQNMTDEEVCQIIMCQYPEEESVDGSVNQDLETSSSPSVPAPRVKIIQIFLKKYNMELEECFLLF